MSATFHEIQNTQAPKLKTPHFIVDHEFKHVEKPFPSIASYMVLWENLDLENHLS